MGALREMSCVACRGDAPTVTEAEIAELHPQVSEWEIVDQDGIKKLSRVFRFDDFAKALAFTNALGELAEEEVHHGAAHGMGPDDGHVVDAQDQRPASQRLHHGCKNR